MNEWATTRRSDSSVGTFNRLIIITDYRLLAAAIANRSSRGSCLFHGPPFSPAGRRIINSSVKITRFIVNSCSFPLSTRPPAVLNPSLYLRHDSIKWPQRLARRHRRRETIRMKTIRKATSSWRLTKWEDCGMTTTTGEWPWKKDLMLNNDLKPLEIDDDDTA